MFLSNFTAGWSGMAWRIAVGQQTRAALHCTFPPSMCARIIVHCPRPSLLHSTVARHAPASTLKPSSSHLLPLRLPQFKSTTHHLNLGFHPLLATDKQPP